MGRKSKRDSRWNTRLEPTKIYDSPFSPVLSSRSSAKRLEKLLQNPLRFTQATDLSLQHEPVSFFPSNSLILNLEHCDMSANSSSNSNTLYIAASSGWQNNIACTSVGFKNPNALRCYKNSLLQALLHSHVFVLWLERHSASVCRVSNCIACELGSLAVLYWAEPKKMSEIERQFRRLEAVTIRADNGWGIEQNFEQQDVHDYYMWLVSAMIDQLPLDAEILQSTFGILQYQETKCKKCGNLSRRCQRDWNITVTCNNGGILLDKLQSLENFGKESLPDIECDSKLCHKSRVTKTIRRGIIEGPHLLCFHISRFQQMIHRGYVVIKKISHHVSFPEILGLSPFVENHTPLSYRLIAVVYHTGTLEEGHYMSATRTPKGGWELQNDLDVHPIDLQQVLAPGPTEDGVFWTPYLLFWEKVQSAPFTSASTPTVPTKNGKRRHRDENEEPDVTQSPVKLAKTSRDGSASSRSSRRLRTPKSSSSGKKSSTAASVMDSLFDGSSEPEISTSDPPLDISPPGSAISVSKSTSTLDFFKMPRNWLNYLLGGPSPADSATIKQLQEHNRSLEDTIRRLATPYADVVQVAEALHRSVIAYERATECYKSLASKMPVQESPTSKYPSPSSLSRSDTVVLLVKAMRYEEIAAICQRMARGQTLNSLRLSKLMETSKRYPLLSREMEDFVMSFHEAEDGNRLKEWLEGELERLEKVKLVKSARERVH